MKLSPCPFCGEQPGVAIGKTFVQLFCRNAACPAQPNAFSHVNDSDSGTDCFAKTAEKWNTRAPTSGNGTTRGTVT